jgi:hypothetical protein
VTRTQFNGPRDEFGTFPRLKNSAFSQYYFINDPRRHFSHIRDLTTIEAKVLDNLTVDAFIGEELHRGVVSRG